MRTSPEKDGSSGQSSDDLPLAYSRRSSANSRESSSMNGRKFSSTNGRCSARKPSLTKVTKSRRPLSSRVTADRQLCPRQDVLARWTDGLLYLGTITKVDDINARCLIRFEDDSEHWTLNKDIQKGVNPGEIRCMYCQGGKSASPNEIVICDHCGSGYHQKCHKPPIQVEVLKSDVKWFCRQCVFTTAAKRGGAMKRGAKARAMQVMKQSLPYDLSKLTWDCHHKTNSQHCYCYCGGPGDWYMKMLQCCRCQQWFHEACIQCLDKPLLCGDQFYLFACSSCNSGPEYIRRLPLTWADLTHLALFNLSIESHLKYSEFESTLMPWIHHHWDELHTTGFDNMTWAERARKTLHSLNKHKSRFQNGREIKKSRMLWALRVRLPPPSPTVVLPPVGKLTDDMFRKVKVERDAANVRQPLVRSKSLPVVPRVMKRRCSAELANGKKSRSSTNADSAEKPADLRSSSVVDDSHARTATADHTDTSTHTDSQHYRGYTSSDAAGCYTVSHRPPKQLKRDLDVLIPQPLSYSGTDHPFMTDLERNEIERRREKRRKLLLRFTEPGNNADDESVSENREPLVTEVVSRKRGRRSRAEIEKACHGLLNGNVVLSNADANKERWPFRVLARRVSLTGGVQYLLDWTH